MPGKDKDALLAARRSLQLQMKELFNLGVLNGPDLALMDSLMVDPTSIANNAMDMIGAADLNERVTTNLVQLRRMFKDIIEPKLNAAGIALPPDVPPAAPPPDGSGMATISTDAEYDALPSGTTFVGPDGKTRRKP